MKSDKTEMVLLGAAAAVIALVVAFSMMDDKGSRKRSLEEITEEVEEEVGAEVEELKDAAAKATSDLSKVQKLAEDLKKRVPPDTRSGKVVAKVQSAVERAKPLVETVSGLIPDETKEEMKNAAVEKAKKAGGWVLNRLKDAASDSWKQNNPFTKKTAPIPLPPGIGVGTRD